MNEFLTIIADKNEKSAAKAKAILRILASEPKMSLSEMSTLLQKPNTWIEKTLRLKLCPVALKELHQNTLCLINAYALSSLSESDQKEHLEDSLTSDTCVFLPKIHAVVRENRRIAREKRRTK